MRRAPGVNPGALPHLPRRSVTGLRRSVTGFRRSVTGLRRSVTGFRRSVTRRLGADVGTHVQQLGEKRQIQSTFEEPDARGTARTAFKADNALDRFHMPEAP